MPSVRTARRTLILLPVFLTLCLSLLAASPAFAQDKAASDAEFMAALNDAGQTAATPADGAPRGLWLWLRMFAALAFVLGLILLAAWLFRRFAPRSLGQGQSDIIRIVATRMLGGRKSLMLVRVRGQTLLLGLTPQSIQCLTEIHELEGEWAQPADAPDPAKPFDRQLNRLLHGEKSEIGKD